MANRRVLALRMTVTWREQNGWQITGTETCSAAELRNSKNLPSRIV
ncbi:hypothetical protein [Bradyrhizobium sp. STM 3561]